jgi:hypothetical protein
MTIEGRKYVRFLAKDNSFAALRNGFEKVGKIDDISINGLGFSFLKRLAQDDSTGHHSQIDIFNSENSESEFHLSNLPCRIVYEISDATPDEGLFIRMTRCGLQFENLTRSQREQLKLFIENFTTGILDA